MAKAACTCRQTTTCMHFDFYFVLHDCVCILHLQCYTTNANSTYTTVNRNASISRLISSALVMTAMPYRETEPTASLTARSSLQLKLESSTHPAGLIDTHKTLNVNGLLISLEHWMKQTTSSCLEWIRLLTEWKQIVMKNT